MRRRSRLGWVVSVYGWRVFTAPVLVVLSVLAVHGATGAPTTAPSPAVVAAAATGGTGSGGGGLRSHPPTGPDSAAGTDSPTGTGSTISGPVADGSFDPSMAAGTLPDGGPYPTTGAGTWHIVSGTTPPVGAPTATVSTYTVEVEDGMDPTTFGGDDAVASVVEHTLAAAQGWTHDGRFAFQRIDTGTPTFRISLTSAATVRPDTECGYQVPLGRVS